MQLRLLMDAMRAQLYKHGDPRTHKKMDNSIWIFANFANFRDFVFENIQANEQMYSVQNVCVGNDRLLPVKVHPTP